MSHWLTEGTAARTRVQRTPVRHLLVNSPAASTGWEMWCSGGLGREDSPHGDRMCRKCRDLAREAVAKGDLEPKDIGRGWDIDVPVEPGLPDDTVLCGWYALCGKPAEGTVVHPVLGMVPTCGRCARKHNLSMTPGV